MYVLSCHEFWRKTIISDLSKRVWNLALKPLKTYLHQRSDYGHHTCYGGELP